MEAVKGLEPMAGDVYRYLNFHEIAEYKEVAEKVIPIRAA
jgi:aconitate hydratase 2/2-methylisocitrate dehydratase